MVYKEFTLEDLEKAMLDLSIMGEIDMWDRWFQMQSPAAQKMLDDAMKAKVKEYCDEA